MKLKLTFFLLFASFFLQAQTMQWAKRMGGKFSGESGYGVTVDAAGNVYTTGGFTDTSDFDPGVGIYTLAAVPGATDAFISKLDASGNFVWAKKLSSLTSGNYIGFGIGTDATGNVYVAGRFNVTGDFDPGPGTFTMSSTGGYDVFILKLDATGNFIWAQQIADQALDLAVDASGNVYTTGYFGGTIDFDPGPGTSNLSSAGGDDIFVSKLDAAGNFVWAKKLGGGGTDQGKSIAIDAAGNVYTSGFFYTTADFDPGAGTFTITAVGAADIFVSKLDASGNFVWAKTMGNPGTDYGYGVAVDASGNVHTTGFFGGTVDFDPGVATSNLTATGNDDIFVSKLDAAGNFVWAKKMGGTMSEEGRSIAVDASGNVYTTGFFNGTVDFDPSGTTFNVISSYTDIFISQLDASGNFKSAKKIGGSNLNEGHSIAIDAACNIYCTGRFRGTADFDPGTGVYNLIAIGGAVDDIFILKWLCTPTTLTEETDPLTGFSIYPNPSAGNFALLIKENFTTDAVLSIYDVLGKQVATQTIIAGTKQLEFLIEAKGMYFIRLESAGKTNTVKLIVQ